MEHKGVVSFIVIALAVLCENSVSAKGHVPMIGPMGSVGWKPWMIRMFGRGRTVGTFGSPWSSKRSVSTAGKRFEITIKIDRCHFDAYDIDGDGIITLTEMRILIFDDKIADDLFKALDLTTADDQVTKEEFKYMAPRTIFNCDTTKV